MKRSFALTLFLLTGIFFNTVWAENGAESKDVHNGEVLNTESGNDEIKADRAPDTGIKNGDAKNGEDKNNSIKDKDVKNNGIKNKEVKNNKKIINVNEYPPGYYSGDPLPDHTVYLTFDDGPTDWTDEILDTLHENNIQATFFISANWAPKSTKKENSFKKYRYTLERMIAEGHVLGNHSAGHQDLSKLSSDKVARQFDLNQELLDKSLGDKAPRLTLIRPPYGHPWNVETKPEEKIRIADIIKTRGLVMMWSRNFNSRDSKEWVKGEWYERGSKVDIDKEEFHKKMLEIYKLLIGNAKGKGMVILFHDSHLTTVKILPELVQKLKSLGYHFATLEDYVKWRWKTGSREMLLKNKNNKQGLSKNGK